MKAPEFSNSPPAISDVTQVLANASDGDPRAVAELLVLRIWNVASRQMLAEVPMKKVACLGLAFSPDERRLVTSTVFVGASGFAPQTGVITLWSVPDGAQVKTFPAPGQPSVDPGTSFAASHDLSVAAYGIVHGRVRVVDLRTGRELWTSPGSKEYVLALAFSPDGKLLASANGFGGSSKEVWEVATGKLVGQLEGHGAWVSSLVFWPDGTKLASSSTDQTIRVWDLASQECLRVLRGHRQEVRRLALAPG